MKILSVPGAVVVFALAITASPRAQARELTFEDRVRAQQAIERVYQSHRIWPKENEQPRPVEETVPQSLIRSRVEDHLRKSDALDKLWSRPVTSAQLQAEIERMARDTKNPRVLEELFAALGHDPFLIAECLARPILVDRLVHDAYALEERFHAPAIHVAAAIRPKVSFDSWWRESRARFSSDVVPAGDAYRPVVVGDDLCADDTWSRTQQTVPDLRDEFVSVWTGSELIVWGGAVHNIETPFPVPLDTGARYNPATDTWVPTRVEGAPSKRVRHVAVWTGTEMIVWGGSATNRDGLKTTFDTGGRYNPVSDTWSATSLGVDHPGARERSTAVWTGTEMIVWGGQLNGVSLKTGGRYDPTTDGWRPTSTGAGAPSERQGHSAIWTGSRMIVWGGRNGPSFFNDGGRYDPSTDSWQPTGTGANVPSPRRQHTATWTGSEMFVWGGSGSGLPVNTGGLYNPVSDSWRTTSTGVNAPAPMSATALWTGDRVIVWTSEFLDEVGSLYDPITDTWTHMTSFDPDVEAGASALWTGSEMLVWGVFRYGETISKIGRYDPHADKWTLASTGKIPGPRFGQNAVWTGSEMIVWGGLSDISEWDLANCIYDPATDSWRAIATSGEPEPRAANAVVWTGREMIIWGGYGAGPTGGVYVNTGGRYDPATDTWRPTSLGTDVPAPRGYLSAVWTGREVIFWGGYDGHEMNTGGRYDPQTDTWRPTSTGTDTPSARDAHTAIWTGREMIVWGGYSAGPMNTGSRYDPATDAWHQVPAGAVTPVARNGHTAVWTGQEMIVWGGYGAFGVAFGTGGRYDPVLGTWTACSTTGAPAARSSFTSVWTGSEMIVWGGRGPDYLETGGRYDPSADVWTATSTTGAPAARSAHSAVWTGRQMIVWGGVPTTSTGALYCAVPACDVHTWFHDSDGDGYGLTTDSVLSCSEPTGYVAPPDDCDDVNPAVHPEAPEACDGIDDDCNGATDEGGAALCNDGNTCTDDACGGIAGCDHADNALSCDDSNACTTGDRCAAGACAGTPVHSKVACNDHNACTQDYCDPDVGCLHAPIVCRDTDPSTIDTCDPRRGCVFVPRNGPPAPGIPALVRGLE